MSDAAKRRTRRALGLWLDEPTHQRAERIASVADLGKSTVIRMAIADGLPIVERRLARRPESPSEPPA